MVPPVDFGSVALELVIAAVRAATAASGPDVSNTLTKSAMIAFTACADKPRSISSVLAWPATGS